VGHMRVFVHGPPDAMPAIASHDVVALPLDVALNGRRDIAYAIPRFGCGNTDRQRLVGHVEQALRLRADRANPYRDRCVADEAIIQTAAIGGEEVALA